MPEKLLIIESPAKARTIKKYLGPDFRIMASVGHVKDLPVSSLGVDIEAGFKPHYVTIKGKGKILKELKAAAEKAGEIYLGPDPDREGEAIAWHVAGEIRKGTKNRDKKILRVLFNELTARAIREAVASPQVLDRNKFESQQARRILDRLVGYQISPLLWKKVKRGLSAGRVQSVAVKMICDREREILAFEPQEYWSLTAHLKSGEPPPFEARLFRYKGRKADLKTGEETHRIVSEIEDLPFMVKKVTKKKTKKNPPPPFTTSLLQQEAFRRLRFSAKKTMSVAQSLYEGVDLGERGLVGLITYMRTDSFRLSNDAIGEARSFIEGAFGRDYLPEKPNRFKSRKGAQEAHEAIRATSADLTPEKVSPYLSRDQAALYTLIWKRFIACQMSPAILDKTQVEIAAGKAGFRANGSVVLFKGFTTLYEPGLNNGGKEKDNDAILPPVREGELLDLIKLDPAQHFTQPPPRFTEASLIKALEENGIGRPSTYAAILTNISGREYVSLEKRRFRPTELGFLVTDLLVAGFPDIMNTAFTAQMENNLDRIEQGEAKWTDILREFYRTFKRDLERAATEMKGEVPANISCPRCHRPMVIKSGRNGIFLACTGYPECRHTSNFTRDEKGRIVVEASSGTGEKKGTCEKCGRPMVEKNGKYGPFIACTGYPECKNIWTPDPVSTGVPCPEEGCDGTLVKKRSRKGKEFYSCSRYPGCRFATWDEPFDDTCPECGTRVLSIKQKKKSGPVLVCRKRGCGYKRPL
ncbi:MAG: type I DNA topoisomerase [Deltaproteobacteria bacterium]|nr:type I DNA topoisomerase [Deltaproteobacteria bacterium]MBW2353585.1 type I DNA topoisomerase [Deltaproteobacteria bacterium]HDZ90573.1 type I DNA topoisomerase [Deltaproteobacteria bacterium]